MDKPTYDIDTFFKGSDIQKKNSIVIKTIQEYMSNNVEALSTPLLELITFGDTERQKFVRAYDIDTREFTVFAKSQYLLTNGWVTVNDPVNLCLYLSYVHTKKREFLDFLGIKIISSLMYKYYNKDGSLNPHIMRFIVYGVKNNKPVMSGKYLLKTTGSTIGLVRAVLDTVEQDFLKKKYNNKNLNADLNIIEVINSISTRLNLNMRGIRDLYEQYKNERLYEQQDITNDEMNITVENETIKMTTLNATITEKIIGGIDVKLVKKTNNTMYFEELKEIYENNRQDLIDYCHYLVKFYTTKVDNVSFENMRNNFVGVVTKAKGLDMDFIYEVKNKYHIRNKTFPRSFLNMHVLLIYQIILDMSS